jgi:hypothetical protein
LIAVALLPAVAGITGLSYLHPQLFTEGFRNAVMFAGWASVAGGVLAAVYIRNPASPRRAPTPVRMSCPLDATPQCDLVRRASSEPVTDVA